MASVYYEPKSGKWYVNYTVGGNRHRKPVGTNKKDAQAVARKIEHQIRLGNIEALTGTFDPVKLADYFNDFLDFIQRHYQPRTAQRYAEITNHFRYFCAEKRLGTLADIRPRHIEQYEAQRSTRVKSKTIRNEFSVLRLFFDRAIHLEYINESPVTIPPPPADPETEARYLDEKEISKLLESSEPYHRAIWTTLLLTGMRSGELTNLEWRDVDFKGKKISIRVRADWRPKDKESRSIPLHPTLAAVLRDLPRRSERYVFATSKGNQLDHVYRRFQRYAKKASIEGASPHTLRHSFASHLVMAGVPLATVAKLLGHSDIKMTMRYAHLAPEHLAWAVDKLVARLPL